MGQARLQYLRREGVGHDDHAVVIGDHQIEWRDRNAAENDRLIDAAPVPSRMGRAA